jgi:hypothetical protein
MKLKVTVNDAISKTGEIIGKGFLGAHVLLNDPDGTGSPHMNVSMKGHNVDNPLVTEHLEWDFEELKKGDSIKVEVMSETPATSPSKSMSTVDKETINISEEHAEEILEATNKCNEIIFEMLRNYKSKLPESEFKQLIQGAGEVLDCLYNSIDRKIYRVHESLIPESLKNMPR